MSSEMIKQNWDFKIIKDNPLYPFLLIDNWYTPSEEEAVWKELDFFSSTDKKHLKRAENTIVARDKDGTAKSNAYRFYTENYYMNRAISHIYQNQYKFRTKEFRNLMSKIEPYGRSYAATNRDTTLISYYEDNDHYRTHFDTFIFTCLIWLVREPRLFDGGDFTFNESNTEIKLKNNRMVMFPCCYLHSVSPIKFHTKPKKIGYGKYTITHFFYSVPTGKVD
tara:strand:+ start:58 stop:723 length:666 start_codon:yes stop_codon:yes gene_type:complete